MKNIMIDPNRAAHKKPSPTCWEMYGHSTYSPDPIPAAARITPGPITLLSGSGSGRSREVTAGRCLLDISGAKDSSLSPPRSLISSMPHAPSRDARPRSSRPTSSLTIPTSVLTPPPHHTRATGGIIRVTCAHLPHSSVSQTSGLATSPLAWNLSYFWTVVNRSAPKEPERDLLSI